MRQLGAGEFRALRRGAGGKQNLERRVYCCRRVSPAGPSDRYARSSSAASVERDPLRRDAEPISIAATIKPRTFKKCTRNGPSLTVSEFLTSTLSRDCRDAARAARQHCHESSAQSPPNGGNRIRNVPFRNLDAPHERARGQSVTTTAPPWLPAT